VSGHAEVAALARDEPGVASGALAVAATRAEGSVALRTRVSDDRAAEAAAAAALRLRSVRYLIVAVAEVQDVDLPEV
jgi:hypothetical protein